MSIFGLDKILRFLASEGIPAIIVECVVKLSAKSMRMILFFKERSLTEEYICDDLYLVDACHGGIPLWDWILLKKGGLWFQYFWPVVIKSILIRSDHSAIKSVLEIDGYTFDLMSSEVPNQLEFLRQCVKNSKVEMVNGTYAQPFFQVIGDESCVRQFYEGLICTEMATDKQVTTYASQEPTFFVQLPQVLNGFGYSLVLLRTHWAPFGTEPPFDSELIEWEGPDHSLIKTIPRYSTQDYSAKKGNPTHHGILNGGITPNMTDKHYENNTVRFLRDSSIKKITTPLISQFADVYESPTAAKNLGKIKTITLNEYLKVIKRKTYPTCRLRQDDLVQTLPWGLQADRLVHAWAEAEAALLFAEQVDARLWWEKGVSKEVIIRSGWNKLLLAQHHDMQVCGTWLSKKHNLPLACVGMELCKDANHIANQITNGTINKSVLKTNHHGSITNLEINSNGTYSISKEGKYLIESAGYFSVWQNGILYDSRNDIKKIEVINDHQWHMEGSVGEIVYEQDINNGNQMEINVTFDFGKGMLFGPQEPIEGYYMDDEKKLCIVFPVGERVLVRDTPFYFEEVKTAHFNSKRWVGIENSPGMGLSVVNQGPAGFYINHNTGNLYRVLAWAPRSWLYDSDDSVSRNGSKFTPISGKHKFSYSIIPYGCRSHAAQAAWEHLIPRLDWPAVKSDEAILTALFIHRNDLYVRLWNPTNEKIDVFLDFDKPVDLFKVNLRLQGEEKITNGFNLLPWQLQTLRVKKSEMHL